MQDDDDQTPRSPIFLRSHARTTRPPPPPTALLQQLAQATGEEEKQRIQTEINNITREENPPQLESPKELLTNILTNLQKYSRIHPDHSNIPIDIITQDSIKHIRMTTNKLIQLVALKESQGIPQKFYIKKIKNLDMREAIAQQLLEEEMAALEIGSIPTPLTTEPLPHVSHQLYLLFIELNNRYTAEIKKAERRPQQQEIPDPELVAIVNKALRSFEHQLMDKFVIKPKQQRGRQRETTHPRKRKPRTPSTQGKRRNTRSLSNNSKRKSSRPAKKVWRKK